MTSYEDFKNTLEGYGKASQAYQGIAHIPAAREEAFNFAREENDQVAAQILANPETPLETVAQAVNIGLQRKKLKLEEIVDNKFSEILKDDKIKKEKLEASLMSYSPKKGVPKKYEALAEAHGISKNVVLYQNKDNEELLRAIGATSKELESVLAQMTRDIVEHYEEKYKEKKGESGGVKKQKQLIKNFFISLYVGKDRKLVRDGENSFMKYLEIHQDKLKNFKESLKTKSDLVKYIEATLPEDKETRLGYLGRLVG